MDPSTPSNTPPPVPQPPVQPLQAPQPSQPSPQPPADNFPGKGLGIAGFVLAFTGTQLIGLILSIVALRQSKKAGHKNTFAFVGVILNSIFLALAAAFIALIVISTFVSYGNINKRANTSSAKSAAANIVKNAEVYQANTGAYPTSAAQISSRASGTVSFTKTALVNEPVTPTTLEFSVCGTDGNKVGYWNYEEQRPIYMYAGTANASSDCMLAAN